jgi:hypothetical protein
MYCDDFVRAYDEQYGEYNKWRVHVQPLIDDALRDCVRRVCSLPPPVGVQSFAQASAVYGVDVMLKHTDNSAGGKNKMFGRCR